jgi:hypothetical protein
MRNASPLAPIPASATEIAIAKARRSRNEEIHLASPPGRDVVAAVAWATLRASVAGLRAWGIGCCRDLAQRRFLREIPGLSGDPALIHLSVRIDEHFASYPRLHLDAPSPFL